MPPHNCAINSLHVGDVKRNCRRTLPSTGAQSRQPMRWIVFLWSEGTLSRGTVQGNHTPVALTCPPTRTHSGSEIHLYFILFSFVGGANKGPSPAPEGGWPEFERYIRSLICRQWKTEMLAFACSRFVAACLRVNRLCFFWPPKRPRHTLFAWHLVFLFIVPVESSNIASTCPTPCTV